MEKHATATVYLVAKINGEIRVLLHKHRKLDAWIGVGGHVESNENPHETVVREVKEETGLLPDLLPFLNQPITASYLRQLPIPYFIFEFKISTYRNEPSHFHIDHVYIGTIKNPRKIRMHEEFRWFSAKDLTTFDLQKEVVYITRKAMTMGKRFL